VLRQAVLALAASSIILAACPANDLEKARALEREGRISEAGELYVDLAKKDPANLGAWDGAVELYCRKHVNVGECISVLDLELDRLGNLERHHDALSEVLELRARARIEQGVIDAALTDLERAEKAGAKRSTVYSAKARAMVHLGRMDDARLALDRAKELDPKNEEIDELLKLLPVKTPEDGFGGKN
jgi:tetratricopeptide (TPR) repeat protein